MVAESVPIFRRPDALSQGWTDGEIRRERRSGRLIAVRPGRYATSDSLATLDATSRHAVLVRAAAGGPVVVSHLSAAVLWGLPVLNADLSRVHFTRVGPGSGRIRRDRHDRTGRLAPTEIADLDGPRLTTVARTLVDIARTSTPLTALAAVDYALSTGLLTPDELREAVLRAAHRAGAAAARRTLSAGDGRSESPGESWSRFALANALPLDLQVEIRDARGHLVGRADLGCEEALLLIEFDGVGKYLRTRAPGRTLEETILAEKRREDALRELGWLVIRIVWSDLKDVPTLVQRVLAAAERGRRQRANGFVPVGTYRPLPRIGL